MIALLALAGAGFSSASSPDGHRGPLALLGFVAAVCVLFRIVDPPTPAGGVLALSLREGAWLALLGSVAMVVGAFLPEGLAARGSGSSDARAAEHVVGALRLDAGGLRQRNPSSPSWLM